MKIYLIGGAVRDKIRKATINDCDYVVVGASIKEMLEAGFVQVGRNFPVFLHPKTHNEYALARKEIKTGAKHTDFKFIFNSDITLKEDVERRDFTCNAVAYDETTQQYIDFVGGIDDIKNKILRHVNSQHFPEDPLRVLRMCRFSAQLNFDVAPETLSLCQKMVENKLLDNLTPERIWKEFEKALKCNDFANFLIFAYASGVLQFLLPKLCEISEIKNQSFPYKFSQTDTSVFALFHYAKDTSPLIKFALLFIEIYRDLSNTSIEEINSLIKEFCARFHLPKSYTDFAISACRFYDTLYKNLTPNTADLANLISAVSNNFRNAEKMHNIIALCQCDLLRQNLPTSQYSLISKLLQRCLNIFQLASKLHAIDMPNYQSLPKDKHFKEHYQEFVLNTLLEANL